MPNDTLDQQQYDRRLYYDDIDASESKEELSAISDGRPPNQDALIAGKVECWPKWELAEKPTKKIIILNESLFSASKNQFGLLVDLVESEAKQANENHKVYVPVNYDHHLLQLKIIQREGHVIYYYHQGRLKEISDEAELEKAFATGEWQTPEKLYTLAQSLNAGILPHQIYFFDHTFTAKPTDPIEISITDLEGAPPDYVEYLLSRLEKDTAVKITIKAPTTNTAALLQKIACKAKITALSINIDSRIIEYLNNNLSCLQDVESVYLMHHDYYSTQCVRIFFILASGEAIVTCIENMPQVHNVTLEDNKLLPDLPPFIVANQYHDRNTKKDRKLDLKTLLQKHPYLTALILEGVEITGVEVNSCLNIKVFYWKGQHLPGKAWLQPLH